MAEVAAKAQQLPHIPWSLTLVTTPCCLQSTSAGRSSNLMSFLGTETVLLVRVRAREFSLPLAYWDTNSSFERSANFVTPILQLCPSALCFSILTRLSWNCWNLSSSSCKLV